MRRLSLSIVTCAVSASFALTLFLVSARTPLLAQQTDGVLLAQRDAGEETSNTKTAELVEDPDGDQQQGRLPSAARRESLKRRAGEKTFDGPQGRAVVLGMHIQEADNQRAKVVDVGPASPAFDAGIRKGDEIVTFDGFHADSYRDWIDGMRKLATEAQDGEFLPVVLTRGDKKINLRLRVPIANARAALPAEEAPTVNQQVVPGAPGQPGTVVAGQQPNQAVGGTGDNVLINDAFGDQFNDASGGATESAIAEIFSLNPPIQTPPAAGSSNAVRSARRNTAAQGQQQAAGAPGQRIGLAGFRNDANGLFVMVDVGGLPPGNYLVGIDDPGVLSAGAVNNPTSRGPQRSGGFNPGSSTVAPPTETPVNGVPRNAPARGATPAGAGPRGNAPASGQPASGAGGGGQPQGRLESPAGQYIDIPNTVLAQVADTSNSGAGRSPAQGTTQTDTPATGSPEPLETPATGEVRPLEAPATGDVVPDSATPTGVPRTADARRDPRLNANGGSGTPGGVGPTNQIGTLTVDQSGTGRLQQVVEGVQVQDVVGQAIVIYSTQQSANTTLPPDLNATADPPAPNVDGRTQPVGRDRQRNAIPQPGADPRFGPASTTRNGVGGQVPVAGGLIRSMSEQSTNPAATPVDPATRQQTDVQTQGAETQPVPAPGAVQ